MRIFSGIFLLSFSFIWNFLGGSLNPLTSPDYVQLRFFYPSPTKLVDRCSIVIASPADALRGWSECSIDLLSYATLALDQAVLPSFLPVRRLSHSPKKKTERLIADGYGLLSRVVTAKLASDITFDHAFFRFSPKKGRRTTWSQATSDMTGLP